MAKTLKEFLEERARRDFQSAEKIFSNASTGLSTDQRLQATQKQTRMWKFLDASDMTGQSLSTQKRGLHRVSLMMLSVAGEAVKKTRRFSSRYSR